MQNFILISYRLIVTGFKSNAGFVTKFIATAIEAQTDFTTATLSFTLQPSGTNEILTDTAASISVATSESITSATYTNQSLTYTVTASTTSDVRYQTNDEISSVVENTSVTITPSLPCSSSGSTAITYSLSAYNGGTLPSWVAIDTSTGVLTVTAPTVSASTQYDFYIDSTVAGVTNPVQKLIKLTVTDCLVTYCATYSSGPGCG